MVLGGRHYSPADSWALSSGVGSYYGAVEDGGFYGRSPYSALRSTRDLLVSGGQIFRGMLEKLVVNCAFCNYQLTNCFRATCIFRFVNCCVVVACVSVFSEGQMIATNHSDCNDY